MGGFHSRILRGEPLAAIMLRLADSHIACGGYSMANATRLRTAVIGVGYLGRFHAQKYAALPVCELVGVVDADIATAQRVASEVATRAYVDYAQLLGEVDAVSIAVPTPLHFQIAKDFLSRGVHVLVEKPITTT